MNLPNSITVVRILLVPAFAWLHWVERPLAALVVFATAALSDGLDGFLARRLGQQTRLGAILDPIADKFLTLTGLVLLVHAALVPYWLLVAALFRDLVVLTVGILSRRGKHLEPAPTRTSKFATFTLMAAIVLALGSRSFPQEPFRSLETLTLIAACAAAPLLFIAAFQYLHRWKTAEGVATDLARR